MVKRNIPNLEQRTVKKTCQRQVERLKRDPVHEDIAEKFLNVTTANNDEVITSTLSEDIEGEYDD